MATLASASEQTNHAAPSTAGGSRPARATTSTEIVDRAASAASAPSSPPSHERGRMQPLGQRLDVRPHAAQLRRERPGAVSRRGQRPLGRVEMPLGRPAQALSEVAALSLRRRRETAARGLDGRHTHPQLALHLRVGQRHRERPGHVLEQPRHPEQRPIVDHDGELLPVAPDRRRDPARIGLTDG